MNCVDSKNQKLFRLHYNEETVLLGQKDEFACCSLDVGLTLWVMLLWCKLLACYSLSDACGIGVEGGYFAWSSAWSRWIFVRSRDHVMARYSGKEWLHIWCLKPPGMKSKQNDEEYSCLSMSKAKIYNHGKPLSWLIWWRFEAITMKGKLLISNDVGKKRKIPENNCVNLVPTVSTPWAHHRAQILFRHNQTTQTTVKQWKTANWYLKWRSF